MRWLTFASLILVLSGCPDGGDAFQDSKIAIDARVPEDTSIDLDLPPTQGDIIIPGLKNRLLLRGTVVTPDQVFVGEVLTRDNVIVCVAASCSADPNAQGATIIDTGGIIFPGLIDAHNHTQYNYLPVWANTKKYSNHGQWQSSSEYKANISGVHTSLKAPKGTDGKGACTKPSDCTSNVCTNNKCENLLCEMIKYGEIRSLIAGTTSIQGTLLRKCADTLVRNLDLPYHGLGDDTMRASVLGVGSFDEVALKKAIAAGSVDSFVIHVAEGIDETARKEFDKLESLGMLLPQTKIIHGTALTKTELAKVAAAKMGIIWSPSSNLALYGKTNDIVSVWNMKIPVALAPDWTPSGEPNVIGELRLASELNEKNYGKLWTPKDLVLMVTSGAADIMGFGDKIGRLKAGHRADVVVISGDPKKPYEALINAKLPAIRMVLVKGKPLYGDPQMISALTPNSYCETVQVCGANKLLCVKESANDTNKLNQSLGDIINILQQAYKPGILTLSTCN